MRTKLFFPFLFCFAILGLLAACTATASPGTEPAAAATATAVPTETATVSVTEAIIPEVTPTALPANEPTPPPAPTMTLAELDTAVTGTEAPPAGLIYQKPDEGIWQIDANGQPQQLTDQAYAIPAPDGAHAYMQVQGDLWLIDLNSGEQTALTRDHDSEGTHLAGFHQWADGDTLFTGIWLNLDTEAGPNTGYPAFIDIHTGAVTILDEAHLMSSLAALGPDRMVAYSSVGTNADDTQLTWIYRPDTGAAYFDPAAFYGDSVAKESGASLTSPAFSPDGRFLAWLASDGSQMRPVVFDLEGQSVTDLAPFTAAAFGGPYPNPVFSNDPNWLVVRQFTNTPQTTGLWLYTVDGQPPTFVAQNGGDPVWINDYSFLFTGYDENYNGTIQQYDALTGVRTLLDLPDADLVFGLK